LALPQSLAYLSLAVLTSVSPAAAEAPDQSLRQDVAACDAGNTAAGSRAGLIYSDPGSADYGSFTSLRFLQKACFAKDGAACGRLALIYYDGEGDVERGVQILARRMQQK
jgi:TPR repeat protein